MWPISSLCCIGMDHGAERGGGGGGVRGGVTHEFRMKTLSHIGLGYRLCNVVTCVRGLCEFAVVCQ